MRNSPFVVCSSLQLYYFVARQLTSVIGTYQQNFVRAKGWLANCGRISLISSRRLCSMSAESVCVRSSNLVSGYEA